MSRIPWPCIAALCGALAVIQCGCNGSDLSLYRLAVIRGRTQIGDVYVVNGEGRVIQRVTSTPDRAEMWPQWAPDGTRVYYEARDVATRALRLCAYDLRTNIEDVVYGPVHPGELWFSLSPDGHKLAYVVKDSSPGQLVVRDIETGSVRSLAGPSERLVRPEWGPDSRQLLCQARTRGQPQWDLVIIDTETGRRCSLGTSSDETEFKGRWSPDGRSVVYSVARHEGRDRVGLEVLDVATGETTTLRQGDEERVVSAAWSTSHGLAALRERPRPMTIALWKDPRQPGDPLLIPLDPSLGRGRLVWSHDGRYLALNARKKARRGQGTWTIRILDSQGTMRRSWSGRMQTYCPAWNPLLPTEPRP